MKKLLFPLLLLLLISACSNSPEDDSDKISIYYFENIKSNTLKAITINAPDDSVNTTVQSVLELLYSPTESTFVSVFPTGLRHNSFSISGTTCTVVFPSQYSKLSTKSQAAIDSALTKTLCSLKYINSVIISCEGTDRTYKSDDFVLSTPKIYYSSQTVNLYFANKDFSDLRKTKKTISVQSNKTLEYTVISSLFLAPVSNGFRSPFPTGTVLNNVYVSNQICYIDLSPEFVTNAVHTKEAEYVIIHSLVNTATELPSVNSVKFLINGNDAYGFTHYDISKPITNKAEFK